MNQIKLHKKISSFFKNGTSQALLDFDINTSNSAREYFFIKASELDQNWFDWIYENNLFTEIRKNEEEAKTALVSPLFEIEYLKKMVDIYPEGVVKVILDERNAVAENNFNSAVVYHFLQIFEKLPAEYLVKVILLSVTNNWFEKLPQNSRYITGYSIVGIVEKLEKYPELLIVFAQSIFKIFYLKKDDQTSKISVFNISFILPEISASGIFEKIIDIKTDYQIKVFDMLSGVISELVNLNPERETENVFKFQDIFVEYETDFFEVDRILQSGVYGRKEFTNFLYAFTILGKKIAQTGDSRLLSILNKIPNSATIWRIKLAILSSNPEVFSSVLEEMLFSLFERSGEKSYFEIEGGAEYQKSLKVTYPFFTKKSLYIKNVFDFFSEKINIFPNEDWHKKTALEILSCIPELPDEDKENSKKLFGQEPSLDYESKPQAFLARSGVIESKSPFEIPVNKKQLLNFLKNEWSPENIKKAFPEEDFFNPRDHEGLGSEIKKDVIDKNQDYIDAILSESELNKIHPEYIYQVFRGFEESYKNKKRWDDEELSSIINVFLKVTTSVSPSDLSRKFQDSWFADWTTVFIPITNILLKIVSTFKEDTFETRPELKLQIFTVIKYLLSTNMLSPKSEHEKSDYGDLYSLAINSVRGRAFELFTVFVEKEGKILSEDSKGLYEEIIKKDTSLAVRFVVGRYLASFYFRDKTFISGLFSDIFAKERPKIFYATFGGYLSNLLYSLLFSELQDYYNYAIDFKPQDHNLEEVKNYDSSFSIALAKHLALSFTSLKYSYIDKENPVGKLWFSDDEEKQAEFISFIGSGFINHARASEDFLREQKVNPEELIEFWDWVLNIKKINNPNIVKHFDFWINPKISLLNEGKTVELVEETLKISNGIFPWNYGLFENIEEWSKKYPEKTLSILRNYFLNENKLNTENHIYNLDEKIVNAFEFIYKKNEYKREVEKLVDDMIFAGGRLFYPLKEIEDNNGVKLIDNIE